MRPQQEEAWSWKFEGLCTQVGADPFFPDHQGSVSSKLAQGLCKQCPVRQRCLDYAMDFERGMGHSRRYGVWGGTTPRQRLDLARAAGEALDEEAGAA